MLTYIIALTLIMILLLGAVYAHLSFGFHRVTKAKIFGNVERPHLHDLIFSKY